MNNATDNYLPARACRQNSTTNNNRNIDSDMSDKNKITKDHRKKTPTNNHERYQMY